MHSIFRLILLAGVICTSMPSGSHAQEAVAGENGEKRVQYQLVLPDEKTPENVKPEEHNPFESEGEAQNRLAPGDTEENRVRGCVSRVWLVSERHDDAPGKLFFRGDSDAHLVRGEIAMLLRIFSGRTPEEILSVDPKAVFERLGLKDALTMQRSNGLFSMMNRIQHEARTAA